MDAPINNSLNGERLWLNVFPDNYLWAEGKKTTSGLFRYFLINNTSSMKSWIVHEEHGFAFCSQFERKSEDFNLFPRTLKNSLHYNTLLVVAKSFRRVAITEWNFSYFPSFSTNHPIKKANGFRPDKKYQAYLLFKITWFWLDKQKKNQHNVYKITKSWPKASTTEHNYTS